MTFSLFDEQSAFQSVPNEKEVERGPKAHFFFLVETCERKEGNTRSREDEGEVDHDRKMENSSRTIFRFGSRLFLLTQAILS
jgi:hypothetical protein